MLLFSGSTSLPVLIQSSVAVIMETGMETVRVSRYNSDLIFFCFISTSRWSHSLVTKPGMYRFYAFCCSETWSPVREQPLLCSDRFIRNRCAEALKLSLIFNVAFYGSVYFPVNQWYYTSCLLRGWRTGSCFCVSVYLLSLWSVCHHTHAYSLFKRRKLPGKVVVVLFRE